MISDLKLLSNIHLWIPDLFGAKGGIQTYSVFLLQALQNLYPNLEYKVIIKHDPYIDQNHSFLKNTKFQVLGKFPLPLRTLFFAISMIINALTDRPSLIMVGHLNFAPVAYWLKRFLNIPYWIIIYGVDAWDITKPNLKIALENADKIISISNYTLERLIAEQNINIDHTGILPCTCEFERFQIAPKPDYLLKRYQLKPQQPIILTVARLSSKEQYKGYDQIIKALPQIIKNIPNIHYLLVGKGDDIPRIKQLISQLQLENYVTLTGFVPDQELCDHYNLCDVFAMPSKAEGFGIVYLEALACGKPTLGGNKDAALDALCKGELGALVDPDNVEEIGETLVKILQSNYLHPIMYQPEILRKKVIEIFGFKQFQKTLDTLFLNRNI